MPHSFSLHPARGSAVSLVAAMLFLQTACAACGQPSPQVDASVYAMAPPAVSELRVLPLEGRADEYRVEVHGGGDPGDGAAVGADCYAVAEGRLKGDSIAARFVPFESVDLGLDAAELAARPRHLTLKFDGDEAELDGDFDYCPMRTGMAGRYRRTDGPRLMKDCPPLPLACWNRD
jgi:hypothetical protein